MDRPSQRQLAVYVSSTGDDLKEWRGAVVNAIEASVFEVINPEIGDVRKSPIAKLRERVAAADVYIGIFGDRYGYIPEGPENPQRLSLAELEYRTAFSHAKPCLIYLRDSDYDLGPTARPPAEGTETEDAREKLRALRASIAGTSVVESFTTPSDLASKVVGGLARLSTSPPRAESASSSQGFHVFFSYPSRDIEAVSDLAKRLEQDGVRVWIDRSALEPGDDWARDTLAALERAPVIAVFIGSGGIGAMRQPEVDAALSRARRADVTPFRLIPVLLPGASTEQIPLGLTRYLWVDFRDSLDNRDAYDRLKGAILDPAASASPAPTPASAESTASASATPTSPEPSRRVSDQDLAMLPDLLFRLVARLRERPEMLQTLEPTAFWGAVRKVEPEASTIADLHSLNGRLSDEPSPGPLWAAWVRHARANELAALLQHPDPAQQE